MNKTVNVKIIRHGYSTANEYVDQHSEKKHPTELKYRNAGLSEKGIQILLKDKDSIKSQLDNPDFIFTSPLKRAIQTCLLVFDTDLNNKIRLVPLITEIGDLTENIGVGRSVTIQDPDLKMLPNFDKIDFSNTLENLFYYDYGWKKNQNDVWHNLKTQVLSDPIIKVNYIKQFLSEPRFTGKNIAIFSHCMVIHHLVGKCPNNLGIASFTFNQDTKEITNIKITDHISTNQSGGNNASCNTYYNKYLKYKSKYLSIK